MFVVGSGVDRLVWQQGTLNGLGLGGGTFSDTVDKLWRIFGVAMPTGLG